VTKEEAVGLALSLVGRSEVAMLGTVNADGYPNIKALSKVATEGIKDVWFVTHVRTRRVAQLRNDARACVYFVDPAKFQGLMVVGSAEIHQDAAIKRRMWQPQFEHYFPLGVDSPEYCVLHFKGEKANFAWGLINVDIDV
jgi:general stress protein 26